ncbi:MAG: hypothetical protein M3Q48_00290 [Actinomycetota bacterium]|nr:hypothetical protein [Actinomycetota bacterium]
MSVWGKLRELDHRVLAARPQTPRQLRLLFWLDIVLVASFALQVVAARDPLLRAFAALAVVVGVAAAIVTRLRLRRIQSGQ